jgi:hypothetical protein
MRRFATFWAFAGSLLMLCLLGGVGEGAKDTDKALRNQRSRSTRATRLDADYDAYDCAGDLLAGSNAASLSRQSTPWQPAPPAIAAAPQPQLPEFHGWEPLDAPHPMLYRASLHGASSGRSPPTVLL